MMTSFYADAPTYAAISQETSVFSEIWMGSLTTPDGAQMPFQLYQEKSDLFLNINGNVIKADGLKLYPNDSLEFYVQFSDNHLFQAAL